MTQSFFGKYTSTMVRMSGHVAILLHPFLKNRENYLVGGDWNHGFLNEFPIFINWEVHHPN